MKIGLKSWVTYTVVCISINGKSTVAYSVWLRRGEWLLVWVIKRLKNYICRVWEIRTRSTVGITILFLNWCKRKGRGITFCTINTFNSHFFNLILIIQYFCNEVRNLVNYWWVIQSVVFFYEMKLFLFSHYTII